MSIFTNTDAVQSGDKLYSEACERNKEPILNALRPILANAQTVLEIGSGSGQHAVYFGQHLPHLTWQTSDLPLKHASIRAWIAESQLSNVLPPFALNIDDTPWSSVELEPVDAIYTSNTLHIISWPQVVKFFQGVAPLLRPSGRLCVYGPFKYGGKFISEGDARFDALLREQNEGSAIRDFEEIDKLAQNNGLQFGEHLQMPANNHLLIWRRPN